MNLLLKADFLDMRDAVEDCAEWVFLSKITLSLSRFIEERLCEENAVGLWQFVQLYRLKRLQDACLR